MKWQDEQGPRTQDGRVEGFRATRFNNSLGQIFERVCCFGNFEFIVGVTWPALNGPQYQWNDRAN